jgi:small subunit ribosomal protein S21
MTKVVVSNGNIDGALKKFKAKVARSGVPSELKKRKYHKKPGVKRREALEEARKNAHKHRNY